MLVGVFLISIELIMCALDTSDYGKGERLNTFECSPNELAAAGFYYCPRYDVCSCPASKIDDRVRCFCSGIELVEWKDGDDPLTEHKKWSSLCEFANKYYHMCPFDTSDYGNEDYRVKTKGNKVYVGWGTINRTIVGLIKRILYNEAEKTT